MLLDITLNLKYSSDKNNILNFSQPSSITEVENLSLQQSFLVPLY